MILGDIEMKKGQLVRFFCEDLGGAGASMIMGCNRAIPRLTATKKMGDLPHYKDMRKRYFFAEIMSKDAAVVIFQALKIANRSFLKEKKHVNNQ